MNAAKKLQECKGDEDHTFDIAGETVRNESCLGDKHNSAVAGEADRRELEMELAALDARRAILLQKLQEAIPTARQPQESSRLGPGGQPQPPLQPCAGPVPPASGFSFCLVDDALELLMAPGDVIVVRGNGGLTDIGTVGGFGGHVLLVTSPPHSIPPNSFFAQELRQRGIWQNSAAELWRVRVMESTRREKGLHESDLLLCVDRRSGQMLAVGEVDLDGQIFCCDADNVELWQSPGELRGEFRLDIMHQVLADMKSHEADWSAVTVARALFRTASIGPHAIANEEKSMEDITACWYRKPICTSVAIIFWQRYFCKLAEARGAAFRRPIDLILHYMPLKADRGLPQEMLKIMRNSGWVGMTQIPRVYRAIPVAHPHLMSAQMMGPSPPGPFCERAGTYRQGDAVEYYSSTFNNWIVAAVTHVDGDANIMLDIKNNIWLNMQEQSFKVRPLHNSDKRGDLKDNPFLLAKDRAFKSDQAEPEPEHNLPLTVRSENVARRSTPPGSNVVEDPFLVSTENLAQQQFFVKHAPACDNLQPKETNIVSIERDPWLTKSGKKPTSL